MTRSYTARGLVVLPSLSSAAAAALGHELLAVARRQPELPSLVAPTCDRLEQAHAALRASRAYMDEVEGDGGEKAADVDRQVDTNWGALHSFLQGWARLSTPGEGADKAERARLLLDGLFAEGLRFLKLPYKIEWAETQKKLDRLEKPDYAEHVKALGAGPFVAAIRESFEAYGVALKLTERRAEARAQIKVREPLDKFVTALRAYVLHVTTYASTGGEGSAEEALAAALLEPLASWRARGGDRKGKPATDGEVDSGDVSDVG